MPVEVLKQVDDSLICNQTQGYPIKVVPKIYFKKVTKTEATKRAGRWKSANCLW